jgi:23S rRNA (cytosine1962-C5)-methyltransferase
MSIVPPPRLELAKDLARHLRGGHPWVFRNALGRVPKLPPGEVVDITSGGRFVARGLYDPLSAIAVRIFGLDETEPLDAALFARRMAQAARLRRELIDPDRTDSFRLVHGESDFLPGVVVDVYAGFAVLKLYSAALTPHRSTLVESLRSAWPGLRGVFGRDEVGREDDEEDPAGSRGRRGKVLDGEQPPDRIAIREEGLRLWVDVRGGQKTGLFLDQRENRLALRRYARNREVLNCFSYTGGFSVSAALGGATRVTSLDLDGDAIALARENFPLNQLDPGRHDFMIGDVFKWLAQWKKSGRSFDLIVLDPPAFAKSQAKVQAALGGYSALNRAALQILRPGGILCTASCSARVSPEAFGGAVAEAAEKIDLPLQLLEERGQPPDHPVSVRFPQGRYLKFFIYRRADEGSL